MNDCITTTKQSTTKPCAYFLGYTVSSTKRNIPLDICLSYVQYIPRNMHTVFPLLCFVVVIHWLIFPYPSGLLHWHCGNLTNAPVPAKQSWWIWINTSCEFIMNDCITTTKQSTTKPCAYFLGYTVSRLSSCIAIYSICQVLRCKIIVGMMALSLSLKYFQVHLIYLIVGSPYSKVKYNTISYKAWQC